MPSIETPTTTVTPATETPTVTVSAVLPCRVCGGSGRVYPVVELAPGRYGTDGTTAPCTHCPHPNPDTPTTSPTASLTASARERVALGAAAGLYLAAVFTLGVHAAEDHLTNAKAHARAGTASSKAAAGSNTGTSATTPVLGARGAGQVDYRYPQLVNADLVAAQVAGDTDPADRYGRRGSLTPDAADAPDTPRGIARAMLTDHGWGQAQFGCLNRLWARESGWDPNADNPASSAVGIPQAMDSAHDLPPGYATSPRVQIRWGLDYIHDRYHTPCAAWAWWRHHHWY